MRNALFSQFQIIHDCIFKSQLLIFKIFTTCLIFIKGKGILFFFREKHFNVIIRTYQDYIAIFRLCNFSLFFIYTIFLKGRSNLLVIFPLFDLRSVSSKVLSSISIFESGLVFPRRCPFIQVYYFYIPLHCSH